MTGAETSAIPLVVGVTGHRDVRPEDRTMLAGQVVAALQQLQLQAPHTPILVLSGMAEGADQLVAAVALQLQLQVVAVLPMPRAIYQERFTSAAALAEFTTLMEQADGCIELPLLADSTAARLDADPDAGALQYELLGAFLARKSHVLLALWDGGTDGPVGGTSQVVRFALEGVPPRHVSDQRLLTEPEVLPVIQIVTARARQTAETDASPSAATRVARVASPIWRYPPAWGDTPTAADRFTRQVSRLNLSNTPA